MFAAEITRQLADTLDGILAEDDARPRLIIKSLKAEGDAGVASGGRLHRGKESRVVAGLFKLRWRHCARHYEVVHDEAAADVEHRSAGDAIAERS